MSRSADIVKIIHILIITFVLLAPFSTNTAEYLLLHVFICIGLLMHWVTNTDGCVLTLLEAKLRGKKMSSTFIHSVLSPLFNIDESKIKGITKVVTILLMGISLNKLYHFANINKKLV